MPAPELQGRYQKAVLWMANGVDDDGQSKVDAAVEVDVRWKGSSSAKGAKSSPKAAKLIAIVDREITLGSILWLGSLAEVPTSPTNLKVVEAYDEIPDVKGRNVLRQVTLGSASDTLPTINT